MSNTITSTTTSVEESLAGLSISKDVQEAVILRAPKQKYEHVKDWEKPQLKNEDEVLVRVEAIGLNPIDWKSADYGFGLPSLPAVNGRDLAGEVVKVGSKVKGLKPGDKVWGPGTDYRDYRKSAFQEYAVAAEHCLGKLPETISPEQAASIGVGAATAAIALGSALGISILNFAPRDLAVGAEGEDPTWVEQAQARRASIGSSSSSSIDSTTPSLVRRDSPTQTTAEPSEEEPWRGEWLLIWGASSVTGFFAAQFALIAGMKVIAVADETKHGDRLRSVGIQHVVDRKDEAAAVKRIQSLTSERGLYFAVDCIGAKTAAKAVEALSGTAEREAYIVGLSGLPKEGVPEHVNLCSVPIKTFHTNAEIGRSLMALIESLLRDGKLTLPEIEVHKGGLPAINDALDRLRKGELSGGRLVVKTNGE